VKTKKLYTSTGGSECITDCNREIEEGVTRVVYQRETKTENQKRHRLYIYTHVLSCFSSFVARDIKEGRERCVFVSKRENERERERERERLASKVKRRMYRSKSKRE